MPNGKSIERRGEGSSTLKMKAIRSSKTSVHTRYTRRHILEDGILHSHRCENLKSYTVTEWFSKDYIRSKHDRQKGWCKELGTICNRETQKATEVYAGLWAAGWVAGWKCRILLTTLATVIQQRRNVLHGIKILFKKPPLDTLLSQINLIPILTPYFSQVYFNIISWSTNRYSKPSHPSGFASKISRHLSSPLECYMPLPADHPSFDHS
jgi:hypothetical protein